MCYLKKLKEYFDFEDYQPFEDEINDLKSALQSKNYLSVIILGPQLMEKIVNDIDKKREDYIFRKGGIPSKDEIEVDNLYNKLVQEESIKARVACKLVSLYDNNFGELSLSKKEFIKYFTKLESIISCRNHLSHEFYKKQISVQKTKRAAKETIEIIELLSYYPD